MIDMTTVFWTGIDMDINSPSLGKVNDMLTNPLARTVYHTVHEAITSELYDELQFQGKSNL